MRGGAGEAYDVWHDGVQYRCVAHPGLDINAPMDTPTLAMSPGILSYPTDSYSPFLGLYAVITLPSGEQHWYAHLSQKVIAAGYRVSAGEKFALSGATGNVTGPHSHIAMRPPHPNFANGFDGFEPFMSHFDRDVYARFNLSLV